MWYLNLRLSVVPKYASCKLDQTSSRRREYFLEMTVFVDVRYARVLATRMAHFRQLKCLTLARNRLDFANKIDLIIDISLAQNERAREAFHDSQLALTC